MVTVQMDRVEAALKAFYLVKDFALSGVNDFNAWNSVAIEVAADFALSFEETQRFNAAVRECWLKLGY